MSDDSVQLQAETFVDWSTRQPGAALPALFRRWCATKDFAPADRDAIAEALIRMGVKISGEVA